MPEYRQIQKTKAQKRHLQQLLKTRPIRRSQLTTLEQANSFFFDETAVVSDLFNFNDSAHAVSIKIEMIELIQ